MSTYNLCSEIRSIQNDENVIEFIRSSKCTKQMVNQVYDNNMTPLQTAACNNKLEIVDALLKKGANIEPGNQTLGPIEMAIYYGPYSNDEDIQNNLKVIQKLIKKKKKIDFEHRYNPFILACMKGKNEIIQLFLDGTHNVDVMLKGFDDKSGVEYLQKFKNQEGIKLVESYLMNNYLKNDLPNKVIHKKEFKL